MDYSTRCTEREWLASGFVIDMGSLFAHFAQLQDRRHARGKRYHVAQVLVLAVLAKLSGEDRPYGMAQWAQLRHGLLGQVLALPKRLPCHNTYRRVLGKAVDADALQCLISQFLLQAPKAGRSVLIAIDGKTLRGTIATGQNQGVHLLAAYLPQEGLVLVQVAVANKENEIVAAPRVLASLDLRGKIVMGDALHTQRELSAQIIAGRGDYIWLVKDNQPQLHADVEQWFQPESHVKGFSPVAKDFQTVRSTDKGHGRREERTLTTSSLLSDYLAWPGVSQVFKLERRSVNTLTGQLRQEVVYGITSLTAQKASAKRLNRLVRDYWGIENGLHYRRDKSLQEDATRMTDPNLAQAMAAINNLIVALILRHRWRYLPEARRHYNACLSDALKLVFGGASMTL
jgi:predicted transposase YbfD/YdcC